MTPAERISTRLGTLPRQRRWYETAAVLGLRWPGSADPAKDAPEVIKGGLAERWAGKAVTEIDEDAIVVVLDEARRRAVPGITPLRPGLSNARVRALHGALGSFFGWLRAERLIKTNPMRELSRPEAPASRERVLSPDELRRFWQAAGEVGEPWGAVLKLLLLTGCRLREIGEMRRSELAEDGTAFTNWVK